MSTLLIASKSIVNLNFIYINNIELDSENSNTMILECNNGEANLRNVSVTNIRSGSSSIIQS